MQQFIEEIIFRMEKDKIFKNSLVLDKYIREKYCYKGSTSGIYKRIVNYQVDKFGMNLRCGSVRLHNNKEVA